MSSMLSTCLCAPHRQPNWPTCPRRKTRFCAFDPARRARGRTELAPGVRANRTPQHDLVTLLRLSPQTPNAVEAGGHGLDPSARPRGQFDDRQASKRGAPGRGRAQHLRPCRAQPGGGWS